MQVTIRLEVVECNTVLEALSNMPYARVFQLLPNIRMQAEEQIREREAAEAKLKAVEGGKKEASNA